MHGYDSSTYGDRFADVYDGWYPHLTDTEACADRLAGLAGPSGTALELGVGTGRVAIPLASRGVTVVGVDSSAVMLETLAAKPGGAAVEGVLGDMAEPPVGERRFDLAYVAFNTLFMLPDHEDQARCLAAVAGLLAPGGSFVLEAFVPEPGRLTGAVEPRIIEADRVVLGVSRSDPERQEVIGQHIEITEAGIRLRPYVVRWSTPEQLDAMAARAGLALADRWADWAGAPFDDDAPTHISRYVHTERRG